jgi:hypothetical protein
LLELKRELRGNKNPSNKVIMEILSERYGWLPSQIRNERLDDIIDYVDIIKVKNIIEKEQSKKLRR